jgi:hypothetical protein
MKKIITISVLAFALIIGVAYAAELSTPMTGEMSSSEMYMPMTHEMSAATYNGVTYFDFKSGCEISEGSGAGGLVPEEPRLELNNGVTSFDRGMAAWAGKGSCIEGTVSAGPALGNGITVF